MSGSDNYSQWDEHERQYEEWLRTRPVCCSCGEPIQEDFLWDINGALYHDQCAEWEFRRDAEGW